MRAWFSANTGTIIVALILTGAVALIIASLINRKKQGASSCGCNCAHCAMGGTCHKK